VNTGLCPHMLVGDGAIMMPELQGFISAGIYVTPAVALRE